MLSTIVLCEERSTRAEQHRGDPAEALVRTLASLVRAHVEGLLRDVVIAGPEGRGLALVADHAGCSLIEAATERDWLRLAVEAARGPDLFVLRAGHAPEQGFIEEAGDFLSGAGTATGARAARLHAVPQRFAERLFPRLAPLAGLIAPRELCLGAPCGPFETLARHIGRAPALRTCARRIV